MIILPAIDIIDGLPVRLVKGDYASKHTVAASVVETAVSFKEQGAEWMHLVDLDGAKAGHPVNHELIAEAKKAAGLKTETGGGIRTMEDIAWYIEHGIDRVILGTRAIEDFAFLEEAVSRYGEKIAVGLDCKDGYARGNGWLSGSQLYYTEFAKKLEEAGVKNIIFTDISKDGTLQGPNLKMLKDLKETVSIDITASGGVKDIDDIKALKDLGLYGAIAGKAIYARTLDLSEAIKEAK